MRNVRDALADDHPLALLGLVSSLLYVTDERPGTLARAPDDERPSTAYLADTFLDVERPETTAVLRLFGVMATDELLRQRIKRAVADRPASLPSWLDHLDEVRPVRAVAMVDVQADGENLLVGFTLPPRHEGTLAIYVDHNLGTLVKDAFCLELGLDEAIEAFRDIGVRHPELGAAPTFERLELADARARVDDAITTASATYPPFTSDSWPQSRALVEWIMRLAPGGGTGYQRQVWPEEDCRALADRFFASPYARHLRAEQRPAHRFLIDRIIEYGADHGSGDPVHMSPVTVEMVLMSAARALVAPDEAMDLLPGVLRSYIPFAHAERDLDGRYTADALDAVDTWEPVYRTAIAAAPDSPAPERLRASGLDLDLLEERTREWAREDLAELADAVGGEDELDRLSDEPLPDEPFDWSSTNEAGRDRVAEIVGLTDRVCDSLFDVEHRTACRRLVADLAAADPGSLHKGRPAQVAAAVCWLIGKVNLSFGYGGSTVKAVLGALGETQSPSQRAYGFLRALGRGIPEPDELIGLGTTRHLVAKRRRQLTSSRDSSREALDDLEVDDRGWCTAPRRVVTLWAVRIGVSRPWIDHSASPRGFRSARRGATPPDRPT